MPNKQNVVKSNLPAKGHEYVHKFKLVRGGKSKYLNILLQI